MPELGSPASFTVWYALVYLVAIAGAWTGSTSLFLAVRSRRRRRLRPDWARMMADTAYFEQAVHRILRARGYQVNRTWVIRDAIERQERELVMALTRRGVPHAALCGRWVIPITSEIVGRFEDALAKTKAQRGMIVTTSHFTEAALQKAAGYPVELVDGDGLKEWIEEIW